MQIKLAGYGEFNRYATYFNCRYDYVPIPYDKLDITSHLNKVKVKLESNFDKTRIITM